MRNKLDVKGYGFLPECEVQLIPFKECNMDLIKLWKIQEKIFKHYYRVITSDALQPKILNLMPFGKKCTKR